MKNSVRPMAAGGPARRQAASAKAGRIPVLASARNAGKVFTGLMNKDPAMRAGFSMRRRVGVQEAAVRPDGGVLGLRAGRPFD